MCTSLSLYILYIYIYYVHYIYIYIYIYILVYVYVYVMDWLEFGDSRQQLQDFVQPRCSYHNVCVCAQSPY